MSIKRWVITQKKLELWQKFFSVEVDETILKVRAKNLVKVTRIGKVMGRKRPPTLRRLSFKFRYQSSVIEARCLKYANNQYNNKHGQH